MKTIKLEHNQEFSEYLNTLRNDYQSGEMFGSSELQFAAMHQYANTKVPYVGNEKEDYNAKAMNHISHMSGIIGQILGKNFSAETATVEDARSLAKCIGEQTIVSGKSFIRPYSLQDDSITETNYIGVLAHISMSIGADMIGDRKRQLNNNRKSAEYVPMGVTTLSGEGLFFDAENVIPKPMDKPKEPTKPNFFKRTINSIFPSSFKEEMQHYKESVTQYEKDMQEYNSPAQENRRTAYQAAQSRKDMAEEITSGIMKKRSQNTESKAKREVMSFQDFIIEAAKQDVEIINSHDMPSSKTYKAPQKTEPVKSSPTKSAGGKSM